MEVKKRFKNYLLLILMVFSLFSIITQAIVVEGSTTKEIDVSPNVHKVMSLGSLNSDHKLTVEFESDVEVYVVLMEDTEVADFLVDGSYRKEIGDQDTSGGFEDFNINYDSEYSLGIQNFESSIAHVIITYTVSGGFNWIPVFSAIGIISIVLTIVAVGIRAARGEKVRFDKDHKGNTKISFE